MHTRHSILQLSTSKPHAVCNIVNAFYDLPKIGPASFIDKEAGPGVSYYSV